VATIRYRFEPGVTAGLDVAGAELLLGHGLRSGAATCGRLIRHNATRMI
jgi:hypothetical protein